jgi:hypothetical protein
MLIPSDRVAVTGWAGCLLTDAIGSFRLLPRHFVSKALLGNLGLRRYEIVSLWMRC